MEVIKLNREAIARLSGRVKVPAYDRNNIKPGIVHIGIGGFHRAHQAFYMHQLFDQEAAHEWGICGIGIREADRGIYEALKKQDFLYTLITRHPDGQVASEVIGAITDFILAVDNPQTAIDKMIHPETNIVSLTITEGGYNFNPTTGKFDFTNPDIQYELANPTKPRTIYGYLSEALRKRKDAGLAPFTILSCDNIQHNGDMTREMVLAFMERQDSALSAWIKVYGCFPNTMVDRITPVTTENDIRYLLETHGMHDEWPVTCEPFIQWVVEDKFSNGRPLLEKVGVQFVPDVSPYEKMKIRLLNAGHSVLGIPGAIHGHATINACMEDPVFAAFMRKFMDLEATPVLDAVKGIDVEDYKDTLAVRFANPNMKDSVSRICSESAAKLPKFLIPTIRENLEKDGSIQYATLVLAAWCFYSDEQKNQKGEPLEIIDVMKNELHRAAAATSENPTAFLELETIFDDLRRNTRFSETYRAMIRKLYHTRDIRSLMKTMVEGE